MELYPLIRPVMAVFTAAMMGGTSYIRVCFIVSFAAKYLQISMPAAKGSRTIVFHGIVAELLR